MRARTLAVNAFDMCCLGHIQQGLWRHPRDRSKNFEHLAYWTDYAHRLERGLFDGLFLADVVGIYDVYQNSPDAAIRSAVQVPVNDPMLIIPAMALVTRHLGFGVTVNLSYESPYLFARRMSTLDHLTQGRIAWNIVTGYLDSAARAQGFQQQMKHDDRYDLADEFMEVVYKLWEDSWADDALSSPFDSRDYADPAKVQAIKHEGKQYRLDARHLCSPSIQRTPMLYQAGASTRGQAFAGKHAECIFLNGQSFDALATLTKAFRAQAVACGRKGEDIKIFVGASLIAAGTKAEAQDRYDEYRQYVDSEAALVHASASMGVDLACNNMASSGPRLTCCGKWFWVVVKPLSLVRVQNWPIILSICRCAAMSMVSTSPERLCRNASMTLSIMLFRHFKIGGLTRRSTKRARFGESFLVPIVCL